MQERLRSQTVVGMARFGIPTLTHGVGRGGGLATWVTKEPWDMGDRTGLATWVTKAAGDMGSKTAQGHG